MNNTEVSEIINQAVEDLNRNGAEIEESIVDNLFLTEEEKANSEQIEKSLHEEIPPNSDSFLVDESTSRFSSAIWYEKIKSQTVLLAGIGGIGRSGNLVNF